MTPPCLCRIGWRPCEEQAELACFYCGRLICSRCASSWRYSPDRAPVLLCHGICDTREIRTALFTGRANRGYPDYQEGKAA